jgi:hypothetical protein
MALVFEAALPDDVAFSHVTAARLLGIPLPYMWRPDEPIHVMRNSSAPPIQRAGCASHRGLERRRVAVVGGLRVVGPADTWCDLGTVVGLDDLVAAADALLAPPWDVPATRLAAVAEGRSGRPGHLLLSRALRLARRGVASPQETAARLLFVRGGLPEPELNANVYGPSGQWLACSDFVWREARVVAEYDGDHHRTDRLQWQYDKERRARLEDAGYAYVEVTSASLRRPELRAALLSRLYRHIRPAGDG